MYSGIGDLVVEEPAQVQEGGGEAHHLLGLGDHLAPVQLEVLAPRALASGRTINKIV